MNDIERIKGYIVSALEHSGGTHSLDDVIAALLDGSAQIFLGDNSVIITEIIEHPRQKHLNYWLVAGDMDEVLSMQYAVDTFARNEGCCKVVAAGRLGWEKVLPKQGWTVAHRTYERAI